MKFTTVKNRRFHVPQPTFLFPLETPLRLSRNMLHGWKDNSMLAKPLAARTYQCIFNNFRVIRCLSQCVSPKSLFLTHFCFPWGRPWGYHARCCMDGKRIRCLQIVSQHVPIYLQQFPSYSNRNFHVLQLTFLFPLETPLRLSPNMFHGWKANSMLAKPFAACTYLFSIVSELYIQLYSPSMVAQKSAKFR